MCVCVFDICPDWSCSSAISRYFLQFQSAHLLSVFPRWSPAQTALGWPWKMPSWTRPKPERSRRNAGTPSGGFPARHGGTSKWRVFVREKPHLDMDDLIWFGGSHISGNLHKTRVPGMFGGDWYELIYEFGGWEKVQDGPSLDDDKFSECWVKPCRPPMTGNGKWWFGNLGRGLLLFHHVSPKNYFSSLPRWFEWEYLTYLGFRVFIGCLDQSGFLKIHNDFIMTDDYCWHHQVFQCQGIINLKMKGWNCTCHQNRTIITIPGHLFLSFGFCIAGEKAKKRSSMFWGHDDSGSIACVVRISGHGGLFLFNSTILFCAPVSSSKHAHNEVTGTSLAWCPEVLYHL